MERLNRAELISLVESVAREIGIAGELRIEEAAHERAPFGEFAHSDVRLSSSEPDSCPVTITLFEEGEADGYVTVSFGGTYHEAWFLSPEEALAIVREFLVALMQGRYEEWRRNGGDGDDSVYGLLEDAGGKVLYSDLGRTSAEKLAERGYVHRTFRPY